jgi:hypothetical protein
MTTEREYREWFKKRNKEKNNDRVSRNIWLVILFLAAIVFFGFYSKKNQLPVGKERTQNSLPQINSSLARLNPQEEQLADFISMVLASTEDNWHQVFQEMGRTYQEPKLVLFSGSVQSACGYVQAAMGPLYCPDDCNVYLDLSFYQDLKAPHNALLDLALAYVVAHEVGHHVQALLGIYPRVVLEMQQRANETQDKELSLRLELQADCFAGVWINRANKEQQILEQSNMEEMLNVASQIWDNHPQQQGQGYIMPDSFTHGSLQQRVYWFMRGIQSGDLRQCGTFSGKPI